MRRKDREITNWDEIVRIVDSCKVLRLAMVEEGRPYMVPLNFGYRVTDGQLTLYIHSAKEGRKIDILKKCSDVCFEMDILVGTTGGAIPCEWSANFESVIGFGNVEFVEDISGKQEGLDTIMRHYGFEGETKYSDKMLALTCVYKIHVKEITAKQKK